MRGKMTGTATALAVATLASAVPAAAQEVVRLAGEDVAIYNLAGHMRLIRGGGAEVVVRVERGGADGGRLSMETGRVSGRETLRVRYPGDNIVYPAMGRGSNTSLRVRSDGTFSDGGEGGSRVNVRGSGQGVEAWADLIVEVPVGRRVQVYVAAGDGEVTGVSGEVGVDTGSGGVTASDVSGSLTVDTGSGSVTVRGMQGPLAVDTGSGDVDVSDVAGPEVGLDTGSGRITAADVRTERLRADTGSGSIDLVRIAAPQVSVDTGSGSIEVELTSDVDRLEIDTGSGSVTVYLPSDLGASIDVETGSGAIDMDFPIEVRSVRRTELHGHVGDGRGAIVIETGSGSVRLARPGS